MTQAIRQLKDCKYNIFFFVACFYLHRQLPPCPERCQKWSGVLTLCRAVSLCVFRGRHVYLDICGIMWAAERLGTSVAGLLLWRAVLNVTDALSCKVTWHFHKAASRQLTASWRNTLFIHSAALRRSLASPPYRRYTCSQLACNLASPDFPPRRKIASMLLSGQLGRLEL